MESHNIEPLSRASFTSHNDSEVHPCGCTYQESVPFPAESCFVV